MEMVIQIYISWWLSLLLLAFVHFITVDHGCQRTAVTHSQVTVAKTHEQTKYVIIQGYI